jgi:hypothetical protein
MKKFQMHQHSQRLQIGRYRHCALQLILAL